MIGETSQNWAIIFGSVVFATVTAICCHALFWRPSREKDTSREKRSFRKTDSSRETDTSRETDESSEKDMLREQDTLREKDTLREEDTLREIDKLREKDTWREKDTSRSKKSVILRIEQVPITISPEELRSELESIVEKDLVLKQHATTVDPPFLTRRSQATAYATATFHTSIPRNELVEKLQEAACGAAKNLPYHFDDRINGVIPLFEGNAGADVDVIAVPGLASHAIGSWKSPSSDKIWLRDFLPGDIPNIRVLLYGYDTSILQNDSKESIGDLGRHFLESLKAFRVLDNTNQRPLIFIGHSLGGLLIKEALFRACEGSADPQNLALSKACYGMLFFGVPNLGLRNRQLKSITRGRPNHTLIQDLVVDGDSEPSSFLKRISDQISKCCRDQYKVISFFERQKSPIVQFDLNGDLIKNGRKILMVTEKSATSTGLTQTPDNIPFNTDHSGLVKYKYQNQDEYIIVMGKLETFVEGARKEFGKRFAKNNLTPEQERILSDLNQPPYTSFRKSQKLPEPEKGTLEWLIRQDSAERSLESEDKSGALQSLRMEDFVSWRDSDKSERLLVTAPPGRGKSVLSNFVLNHLESRPQQQPTKIVYYFCNIKNDETSRNANSILRALIVQLCEGQQRIFQKLLPEYEKKSDRFFSADFATLLHMFEQMLRDETYAQIYCVIDGLDVYREGMSELIIRLIKNCCLQARAEGPVLKLLCTARPENSITDLWESTKCRILRCSQHDLRIFVESRVTKLGERFTDDMKEIVKSQLLKQADSTFLWLDIIVRRLKAIKRPTNRNIEQLIKDNPQDLNDLFRLLIDSLVQEDRDSARILACVVHAREPLDLSALQDAVAIDPTKDYAQYKEIVPDKSSLTPEGFYNSFGTLLDVIADKVYCIHQSLRDFIIDQKVLEDNTSVSPRLVLAHITMTYLSLEDFGQPFTATDMSLQNFALFKYAANYWYSHIEAAEDIVRSSRLQNLLKKIIRPDQPNVQAWMEKHRRYESYSYSSGHPSRISDVAITFDIGWLAEVLLDKELDSMNDDFEMQSLSRAAKGGRSVLELLLRHEGGMKLTLENQVVESIASYQEGEMMALLLYRRGAEVQITENVVKAAAGNSDKNMMRLLLDQRGAEVRVTEDVVIAAVWNSNINIMRLLLDQRGAEVRVTEDVVIAAARNSNINTMRLLLDQPGAEIQITEGVIEAAAKNSFSGKDIITLLLEKRGAEVRITEAVVKAAAGNWSSGKDILTILLDQRGAEFSITGDAVIAAAEGGSGDADIMRLLLDKGADVNAQGGNYGNALQAASIKGYQDVVQLLLDKGADVNAQGGFHDNALQAALSQGHQDVVQLLLDKGADVNAQGGFYGNALQAASIKGYQDVVQLLLDKGADVNAQGGHYGNALQAASYCGHIDIIKLLLEHKADTSIADTRGWTSLHVACDKGDLDLVKLLLEHRADTSTADTRGWTSLRAACDKGHVDVVKLLLEYEADITIADTQRWTSLHVACDKGHVDVVKALLEAGADPLSVTKLSETSLHLASRHGVLEIVDLLMAHGCDTGQMDDYGRTYLDWALDCPLFMSSRKWASEHTRTPEAASKRVLQRTIARLVDEAISEKTTALFYDLGRCLLFVGDEQNASFALRVSSAQCNRCTFQGFFIRDLYVCRSCADTDLCGECFKIFREEKGPWRCHSHTFTQIPYKESGTSSHSVPEQQRHEWLIRMREQYKNFLE